MPHFYIFTIMCFRLFLLLCFSFIHCLSSCLFSSFFFPLPLVAVSKLGCLQPCQSPCSLNHRPGNCLKGMMDYSQCNPFPPAPFHSRAVLGEEKALYIDSGCHFSFILFHKWTGIIYRWRNLLHLNLMNARTCAHTKNSDL